VGQTPRFQQEEFAVKRYFISALVAGALAFPAAAALKTGEKAPDFKAPASLAGKAKEFSLAKALKKGPVVVYFYPAAFTGGCNAQAHAFAENADKFAAAKTTIIGVSGDNIKKLNDFSADPLYCAGKFAVAADPEGTIGKSFGLTIRYADPSKPSTFKDSRGNPIDNKLSIERTTFVITPDHKIISVLSSADDKIKSSEHAEKSLAVVQALATRKPS
jgi:peroxiredoxin